MQKYQIPTHPVTLMKIVNSIGKRKSLGKKVVWRFERKATM